MANDKKLRRTIYFPQGMLEEITAEAKRQDRSVSWIMQTAWRVARERIRSRLPTEIDDSSV